MRISGNEWVFQRVKEIDYKGGEGDAIAIATKAHHPIEYCYTKLTDIKC